MFIQPIFYLYLKTLFSLTVLRLSVVQLLVSGLYRGCHCRDHMVVEFLSTCAISAYHHLSWRSVLDTTLGDKVCQWLAAGQWFSLGTLVFSTNKTDHNNITEILLKVVLNTITTVILLSTMLWSTIFFKSDIFDGHVL